MFTVMPFSLCNAPVTFERLIELVPKDLNWKVHLIYMEDIVIGRSDSDESLDQLKLVWAKGHYMTLQP